MSQEDLNLQRQKTEETRKQYEYNEAQAQQTKERIEQDKIVLENLKKMNFSYDKQTQVQTKIVDNMIELAELQGGMSDKLRAYASLQNEVNTGLSQSFQLQENIFTKTAGFMRDITAAREAYKDLEAEIAEETEKQSKELEAAKEAYDELLDTLNERLEKGEIITDEEQKQLELAHKRLEIAEQEEAKLDKKVSKLKEITDQLEENEKALTKAGILKAAEQAGKLANAYTDNVFGKIQGIGAEMYKATGGSTQLIDTIEDAFTGTSAFPAELAKFGLGFEELSQSMVNLSQRSGEFATASAQVQKEVGLTTAKLERLGVSTETSADLFNTMRLNFGFSASEFGSMADEMVNNASAIGMSVEQYTQDFQSSFPVLSQHGTNAVRVFDNLARAAKASGMSVQELAQSMSQFDTFQSSAENASKLNFLLGSQLDTTQLLMADEAERLDMIKGAFSPAQFQNMDKFKKKAIAAAAGFSDVGAFEKAMRGDAEALGSLAKDNADDLDSATQKSTAATLAFSKGLENAKDQAVLAIHDLSDLLGGKGQSLYATGKVLSTGLENLAGVAQATTAALQFMGTKMTLEGAKGKIDSIKNSVTGKDGLLDIQSMGKNIMGGKGWKGKLGAIAKTPIAKSLGGIGALVNVGTTLYDVATKPGPMKAKDIGGTAGSVLGGAIGLIGGPLGSAVGSYAGEMIGEIAGGMMEKAFGETKEEKKKREQNEARVQELLQESVDVARENARHAKKLAEDSEWNKNKANFRSIVGTRRAHMPTQRSNN